MAYPQVIVNFLTCPDWTQAVLRDSKQTMAIPQTRDLANFSKQGVQMGLVYEVGCPSPTASGGRPVRRRRTAIAAGGLGAA